MRALGLAVLVAACSFPKPPDQCDGPCKLFAIDRALASRDEQVMLEGTFENGARVKFPGATNLQPLDSSGSHRAAVTVPADATAGELTITWKDGTSSGPVAFRRPTFKVALQAFSTEDEQTDAARLRHVPNRSGHVALLIGSRVYQIGGQTGGSLTAAVDASHAGLDGSLGAPFSADPLENPRAFHTAVRVGSYVYVLGGMGASNSVERAPIETNGELGPFSPVPGVNLVVGRHHHASVVIGNYIYVIGGLSDGGIALGSLERAWIFEDGHIGSFEPMSDVALMTPRSGFSVALVGEKLFVIGGMAGSQPTRSVELADVYPDSYIGQFQAAGSLQVARHDHACVVLGEDVYVFGGDGDNNVTLDSGERSQILGRTTLSFSAVDVPKLFRPRRAAAPVVVGNYVYLLGGLSQGSLPATYVERASFVDFDTFSTFALDTTTMLATERSEHASVVIGNRLYVLGGTSGGMVLDTIESATIEPDGSLGPFTELTSLKLKVPRVGPTVMVANNELYVVGGSDTASASELEKFLIGFDGTLSGPTGVGISLLESRRNFTTVITGANVHVISGETSSATVSIEGAAFAGTDLAGMALGSAYVVRRRGHASAVLGRYIYVIGGFGATYPVIERIHVADNGFFDGAAEQTAGSTEREGLSAAVIGDTLVVLGGRDGAVFPEVIESAAVAADGTLGTLGTLSGAKLMTPRAYATTVMIGNRLYVIGGHSDAGDTANIEYSTVVASP